MIRPRVFPPPNEGDKPARIAFSVTAGGVHYYVITLKLAAHETRAIDLSKLRDAQQFDFKGNKISADATDGSVTWNRLDDAAVSGRLVVLQRHKGTASSYDCCNCACSPNYWCIAVSPTSVSLAAGGTFQLVGTGSYEDCNNVWYFYDVTSSAAWPVTSGTAVTVNSMGLLTAGVSGGSASLSATFSDFIYPNAPSGFCTGKQLRQCSGGGSATVVAVSTSGPHGVPLAAAGSGGPNHVSLTANSSPSGETYSWSTGDTNKVSLTNTSSEPLPTRNLASPVF